MLYSFDVFVGMFFGTQIKVFYLFLVDDLSLWVAWTIFSKNFHYNRVRKTDLQFMDSFKLGLFTSQVYLTPVSLA